MARHIPHGRYSQELKLQAAKLVEDDGLSVAEVGRRLDVPPDTLRHWVLRYRKNNAVFAAKTGVSEQDMELARLRRENAILREERDILKKAAAYFAKGLL
jgi:transposase